MIYSDIHNKNNTNTCGYKTANLSSYTVLDKCIISLIQHDIIKSNYCNIMLPTKLKNMVKEKSSFIFDDVNLDVVYVSYKNYMKCLCKKSTYEVQCARLQNIFDIPIRYSIEGSVDGYLLLDEKISTYIVRGINIYPFDSENCYVHEICHPLLDRVNDSMDNYLYSELMPIFTTLIYGYENYDIKTAVHSMVFQLKNIQNNYRRSYFTEYRSIESRAYLVSTLLSINLFDKYIHGTNTTKKDMLCNVKEVFNNNQKVEDFLNRYDVSIYNDNTYDTFTKVLKK